MAASATPPWHLEVEFIDLDLEDDAVLDALTTDPSLNIMWSSHDGVTTADSTIHAASAVDAFRMVCGIVTAANPDARPVRVVDPLVTTVDIAEDAGVSRQAVRNWSLGLRQSGFPRPLTIVGDGIRVWRRADVDAWLHATVNLGSDHKYPSPRDIVSINEMLAPPHDHHDPSSTDGVWDVGAGATSASSELSPTNDLGERKLGRRVIRTQREPVDR